MTADNRFRSTTPLLLAGLVILFVVALGGWVALRFDEVPACESPEAVLVAAVDAVDVDWLPLSGDAPTGPITWLQGEVPGQYPAEICEKAFFDSPNGSDAVNNVSLHRYPSAGVARTEFAAFSQDAIDYGDQLVPGHRYQPDDRQRSAHLFPDSCLVVSVTWETDNLWDPDRRHATVLDAFESLSGTACPTRGHAISPALQPR